MAEPGGTLSTGVSQLPWEQWPAAQRLGVLVPRTGNLERDKAGRLQTGYMGSGFFGGVTTDDIIEQESRFASEDQRFRSRNEDSLEKVRNVFQTPSDEEIRQRWKWGDTEPKDSWGKDDRSRTIARVVARNWAIVNLGMDPKNIDEVDRLTNIAGTYDPKADRILIRRADKVVAGAKAAGKDVDPEIEADAIANTIAAFTHESMHRTIAKLAPKLKEKGVSISPQEEEALLHWFDRKYSADTTGKVPKGIDSYYRSLIRKYNPEVLLRTINTIAEEELARRATDNPRGPR